MPGAGTGDLTSAGLTRWRERIRREEAVNARVWKDGFSVRSCVRSRDVPVKFKPQQATPADLEAEAIDISSPAARELRAALDAGAAPPQQRLLWPETSQHCVGWLLQAPQKSPTAAPERGLGLASGCLTARSGLGWLHHEAPALSRGPAAAPRGGAEAEASFLAALPNPSAQLTPQRSSGHATRGSPSTLATTPRLPPTRRVVQLPGGASPRPGPPPDPWSEAGGSIPLAAAELPRPTTGAQMALAAAAERHRRFQNGTGNPWYRGLGSSDVSDFANAYTRSWGMSMFAKKDGA